MILYKDAKSNLNKWKSSNIVNRIWHIITWIICWEENRDKLSWLSSHDPHEKDSFITNGASMLLADLFSLPKPEGILTFTELGNKKNL